MQGMKINHERARQYMESGQWTDETLLDRWERSAAVFADREYVVDNLGRRFTYRDMDRLSERIAAALLSLGVTAGEVVTYQITPRSEFVALTLACFKIGAVAAPLGMCFEGNELRDLLKKLNSRFHFYVPEYRGRPWSPAVDEGDEGLSLEEVLLVGGISDGLHRVLEEIMPGENAVVARHHGHGNDLALILCTSGTTRSSKAVMFTHNNIIFSEDGFNRELGLTSEDTIFMPAPLHHATGFHHGLISPMLNGGGVVLQERFDCAEAVCLMNREKCTYSMGATPFIFDLVYYLDENKVSLPHLRFYICGGAPVPAYLVDKAYNEHGILVCECYGSTESVPHLYVRPEAAMEMKGLWSGLAMEGVEVRIVDENHNPVPPGVVGEEASRGPNVFVGYLNEPELTNEVLDDDGWYYSGDLCVMNEEGWVKVVGRKKDVIIRGGENLNANDLAAELDGCPGIRERTVIGMPDPRLGERICAFVVCQPGGPPVTKESIAKYLDEKGVNKRHWPERVELIDQFPRTESGKVKKHLLLEELKRRMAQE